MSFDPSEAADGLSASGRRRGVSSMRSEVSLNPSAWGFGDSSSDGSYREEGGVGASVRVHADGRAEVIGMVRGGAAERSGVLQVGDLLLSVDGVQLRGLDQSEVQDLVMGAPDTLVQMELLRGATVLTVELRRTLPAPRDSNGGGVRPVQSGEFDPSVYAYSGSEDDED
jgi:hypothetical protein